MSFYHLNPNRCGERLARRLEQLGDYRVLRRLPRPEEIWCRSMPFPDKVMKLGVIDCETTGLDPERHKMIELAIGTLSIDLDTGDVVDVTPPQSWLEDPADDLPIEIERLTHIHPDPHSFNHGVAKVYCDAVRAAGQDVVLRYQYALGFDPVLKSDERPTIDNPIVSRDVTAELNLLAQSDVFVLIYAIWFGSPPAMMKGHIDRVLAPASGPRVSR